MFKNLNNLLLKMDLSIVIPVYNEEENIQPLYSKIKNVLKNKTYSYEIIFINDGSKDFTLRNLEKIQKKDFNLRVLSLPENKGLSKALEFGFSKVKGEIVISLDGDMQHDPRDITKLIGKLQEGYDTVCGWRYKRKDPLFIKKIPSDLFNTLLRLVFNLPIHDSSCTLRAYKQGVIKNIHLKEGMHRFIPLMLFKKGYNITEVRINHLPRIHGKAKYNSLKRALAIKDIIRFKIKNEK